MARIARPVFPGLPHHIVQRGNRREDVFFTVADRRSYLAWLGQYCRVYRVELLAYCLMTNHVHVVMVPATEDALEQVFRPLHTRYAQRLNRRRGWTGHVWQGRYFSATLDEAYLWSAVRYVERNPVRAGMVRRAELYPWSSAAAHCGLRQDDLLTRHATWLADLDPGQGWSRWLAEGEELARVAVLRHNVQRGLPCGSDAFVSELERKAGQSLRPRPPGRRWPEKPGPAA